MSDKPKIPTGWRELKRGLIIRVGDKYAKYGGTRFAAVKDGHVVVGERYSASHWTTIRKVTKPRKTSGRVTKKTVRDVLASEDRARAKLSSWEIQQRIEAGVEAQPTYGR